MKTPGTQPAYPNINEIEQYLQGSLPASRSREIELLAMEDPMVADAIEGYSEVPAFDAIQELQFQSTTSSSVGGTPWWHITGWIVGVSVGVILAVIFIPKKDAHKTEQSNPVSSNQNISSSETPLSNSDLSEGTKNPEIIPRNSSASISSPLPDQTSPSNPRTVLIRDFSEVIESDSDFAELLRENPNDDVKVIQMDSDLPVLLDEAKRDPAIKESIVPGGTDITHFNNYKLVDYTILRKKTWPDFSLDSLHTSPSLENEFDKGDPMKGEISQSVPYITYLERCINEYSMGEHKRAAEQFDLILKQYPNDLNAQFYGGMSYFQIGEYDKAISLFDKSLKNVFKIFREESEFYKAVSLRKLGREEESLILLLQIINNDGYYKTRALEEVRSFE
jgi:Tetratricopeptide repeat